MESFAARVPVVVSDTCGFPEVVRHGQTGIVTRVNNPDSLAWGILEVLNHPDTLLIGIAPSGGILPPHWLEEIKEGVRAGLSLVNGLHTPLKPLDTPRNK